VQITGKHCSKKNLLFSTYLSSPELEKKSKKKRNWVFFEQIVFDLDLPWQKVTSLLHP
jgi:uncharacterized metal-binding protein